MLLAVISSLIMIHSREIKSNGIVPDLIKVIWKILELRLLVLVSFFLQIILILFGNRRRYIANIWLQLGVWLTYLSADWVATFALGILSKDSKNPSIDPNFIIWAPFLLVHLGGPDTFTAYSPEDNELWLRHLIGLISQVIVAGPVVHSSLNGGKLYYVTIPVMVAGIIKYGERTWSLWLGSSNKFRESILPPPNPGPNYAYFSYGLAEKLDEGYKVKLKVESTPISFDYSQTEIANESIQDAFFLQHGFDLLTIFEFLFADLILSIQDHHNIQYFFQNISWDDAFKLIEVELGLMYDKLYTKAVATYSRLGIFLKFVSFFCTFSAFITFCRLIDKSNRDYDRTITLVLFVGAMLLEIYAVIVLVSSSWAMLWLSRHKNWKVDLIYKSILHLQTGFNLSHTTNRWSNLVSQFNLISFCLKSKRGKCIKILKFLRIHQFFVKSCCQHTKTVPDKLKRLIFKQLLKKSRGAKDIKGCKKLCALRGDGVLHKANCHSIDWSTEVEFDRSLLLWHITTDLCHYSDVTADSSSTVIENYQISKLLSNYMLYLLVKCPFMLPNGIGQIRFEDTCAGASKLLQEMYISERDQLCQSIIQVDTNVPPSVIIGEQSKSVLFDASRLAKSLESLEKEKNWSKERKSQIIRDVWVEMLYHAASQCKGLHHGKQLSRGGELLTHVWLLMAHLGITEQFQISQGHARTKLILS